MEPSGLPEPSRDFHHVRLDGLRRAVDLYLGIAYPDGAIPAAVRKRIDWDPALGPDETLRRPPFEKVGEGDGGAPIVALRLGNVRYPHMKLQIQPWASAHGILLSVNTHDQVLALDPDAPDAPAFRALQGENQRIKEEIEGAWDREGLPTFHRYLLDYLAARPEPAARETA